LKVFFELSWKFFFLKIYRFYQQRWWMGSQNRKSLTDCINTATHTQLATKLISTNFFFFSYQMCSYYWHHQVFHTSIWFVCCGSSDVGRSFFLSRRALCLLRPRVSIHPHGLSGLPRSGIDKRGMVQRGRAAWAKHLNINFQMASDYSCACQVARCSTESVWKRRERLHLQKF
jgi:hypothetical protein